jgi:hypothetical protein
MPPVNPPFPPFIRKLPEIVFSTGTAGSRTFISQDFPTGFRNEKLRPAGRKPEDFVQGKIHSLENKTISHHYQGKSVTFGLTPPKENRTFLSQS